ncbi:tRNA (guanosine(37)-N1)-methyltransferase TrmD [Pleionea sediminis]|uniref:tRNA (guanosine(37)-N1)-methyltransferase TrmD n=1 Tax=Pleionea sediminis TaxID=2569479 RepID=UPI003CCC8BF2
MVFSCVTLFPEMFRAVTEHGVTGRAIKDGLVDVSFVNPRDYTTDKHRTVDDRPYGGGPGMLMMVEPLRKAIAKARETMCGESHVVYLSPQGSPLNQSKVEQLVSRKRLILVSGRYEGVDERIIESQVDEEVSLGDFVLSGGELASMALIDAAIRFVPGALGHSESAVKDSFVDGLLDCPHYTRPEILDGRKVPDVLLSGNHAAIEQWRLKQSLGRTWLRRPELLEQLDLTSEQQKLLAEFKAEYDKD